MLLVLVHGVTHQRHLNVTTLQKILLSTHKHRKGGGAATGEQDLFKSACNMNTANLTAMSMTKISCKNMA